MPSPSKIQENPSESLSYNFWKNLTTITIVLHIDSPQDINIVRVYLSRMFIITIKGFPCFE